MAVGFTNCLDLLIKSWGLIDLLLVYDWFMVEFKNCVTANLQTILMESTSIFIIK